MCHLFELKKIDKFKKRWHTKIKNSFFESYTLTKKFENKKTFVDVYRFKSFFIFERS